MIYLSILLKPEKFFKKLKKKADIMPIYKQWNQE